MKGLMYLPPRLLALEEGEGGEGGGGGWGGVELTLDLRLVSVLKDLDLLSDQTRRDRWRSFGTTCTVKGVNLSHHPSDWCRRVEVLPRSSTDYRVEVRTP